jgi:hypothetical protein
MQNIEDVEDVKEDPCELGESEYTIPTYHWSEVHSPRLNDLTVDIFSTEVVLTQKVPEMNQQKFNHCVPLLWLMIRFGFFAVQITRGYRPHNL